LGNATPVPSFSSWNRNYFPFQAGWRVTAPFVQLERSSSFPALCWWGDYGKRRLQSNLINTIST